MGSLTTLPIPRRRRKQRSRAEVASPVSTSASPRARSVRPEPEPHNSPTWLVDRIVDSQRRGKRGKVFYRVKWEDNWEPAESLQGGADAAIAEYFRLGSIALGQ